MYTLMNYSARITQPLNYSDHL